MNKYTYRNMVSAPKKEVEIVAAMLGKSTEELIEEMPILREVLGHG